MSQENVEVVRSSLEGFIATGVVDWHTTDEEVVLHDHDVPEGGRLVGRSGYDQFIQTWSDAWVDWSMEPQEYLDAGDRVVVFVGMRATGSSGISLKRDDAIVYTLRDGLIVAIDYYNNRPEALATVRLESSG